VFTKDEIHTLIDTLIDFVMADPTCADLLPQRCTTQGFVTFNAIQIKKELVVTNTPLMNSSNK
jgi:hypothetical protein